MDIVFEKLPVNLEEMKNCEYATLEKPEYAAALFIVAMKVYPANKDEALSMVQFLMGPQELKAYDKQALRDRMARKADYIANSFFNGATPENDYTPSEPYTIAVNENPYSYVNEGYAKLFIKSGGADRPSPIIMRHKPSTNQWFLSEQLLLSNIRQPKSADPWA